jgi:alkaline phosphatase
MTIISGRYRRCLFQSIVGLLAFGCLGQAVQGKLDGIVLVISDGTSLELITAARNYSVGPDGQLALESFPHTAFVRTYSASDMVTDSGAAATAMARGIKADNRMIGMAHPDALPSPQSILDLARKTGWSTAVVTDDSVTGATPAPFLVEHPNRDQHEAIASKIVDQLGGRGDIILGGGAKWFFDRMQDPDVVVKAGERPVVQTTQEKLSKLPVAVFDSWADFSNYAPEGGDLKPVLGVFYPDYFPYFAARDENIAVEGYGRKDRSPAARAGKAVFSRSRGEPAR